MTNDILTPPVLEMLTTFENVLKGFDTDFYLVGAIARDIMLSSDPEFASTRKTDDVDIAIMITDETQFHELKDALIRTGDFAAHDTEEIKLFYKHSVEVDLMPFGKIENHLRETRLEKPRLFVLDVPGFMEVLPYVKKHQVGDQLNLKVCTLEGIILLKIIANNDKPSRTKDINDIEHIISQYFSLCSMDIFSNHEDAADLYDTALNNYMELVSARVIGRKMAAILENSPALKIRVYQICDRKRSGNYWAALADGMEDIKLHSQPLHTI